MLKAWLLHTLWDCGRDRLALLLLQITHAWSPVPSGNSSYLFREDDAQALHVMSCHVMYRDMQDNAQCTFIQPIAITIEAYVLDLNTYTLSSPLVSFSYFLSHPWMRTHYILLLGTSHATAMQYEEKETQTHSGQLVSFKFCQNYGQYNDTLLSICIYLPCYNWSCIFSLTRKDCLLSLAWPSLL